MLVNGFRTVLVVRTTMCILLAVNKRGRAASCESIKCFASGLLPLLVGVIDTRFSFDTAADRKGRAFATAEVYHQQLTTKYCVVSPKVNHIIIDPMVNLTQMRIHPTSDQLIQRTIILIIIKDNNCDNK